MLDSLMVLCKKAFKNRAAQLGCMALMLIIGITMVVAVIATSAASNTGQASSTLDGNLMLPDNGTFIIPEGTPTATVQIPVSITTTTPTPTPTFVVPTPTPTFVVPTPKPAYVRHVPPTRPTSIASIDLAEPMPARAKPNPSNTQPGTLQNNPAPTNDPATPIALTPVLANQPAPTPTPSANETNPLAALLHQLLFPWWRDTP